MGETKEREKKYNKGPFTLGVQDSSVESTQDEHFMLSYHSLNIKL